MVTVEHFKMLKNSYYFKISVPILSVIQVSLDTQTCAIKINMLIFDNLLTSSRIKIIDLYFVIRTVTYSNVRE